MRRHKTASLGFGVVLVSALVLAATLAVASDEQPEESVFEMQLNGMALIQELGLPEIPNSGTNDAVNCKWAIEWEETAYCLDSVAGDLSAARLVGAQIRGAEITAELENAMDAYDVMRGAQEALAEAQSSGASDEELSDLAQQVEIARRAYEDAIAVLPAD